MFSSKPIHRHYLFTISCEGKIVNLENLFTQFLFDLIGMLSKLVTPGVLQPTPLKRISFWDSEQESEKEKTRFRSLAEITVGDYTTSKLKHLGI
jgi:hypothetical protein